MKTISCCSLRQRLLAVPAHGGRRWLSSCLLGLAAVGASAALSGCDSWMGNEVGTKTAAKKATYINRLVGPAFEGISLNPDGTYNRMVIDHWGRAHEQTGTWRGYGGTVQNGKSRISQHLELDGYSDLRDVLSGGDAKSAPKSTKTLSPGDFNVR